MPRWLEVALTLVLFLVAMAGVTWLIRQTVPGFNAWLGQTLGEGPATLLVFGLLAVAAVFGYWPRDASGKMRRLRSPWD